jgi:hypothetical protein
VLVVLIAIIGDVEAERFVVLAIGGMKFSGRIDVDRLPTAEQIALLPFCGCREFGKAGFAGLVCLVDGNETEGAGGG